jgi:hypothetical protein
MFRLTIKEQSSGTYIKKEKFGKALQVRIYTQH